MLQGFQMVYSVIPDETQMTPSLSVKVLRDIQCQVKINAYHYFYIQSKKFNLSV